MKWYSDRPDRFALQLAADLVAVAWTWFWIDFALGVRDSVLTLRTTGEELIGAGQGLGDTFRDAADRARGMPLVGDDLASALQRGQDAGTSVVGAGQAQIEAVETTALWLAVAFVALPVAFLLITWLPLRYRFARRATAARTLRDAGREDLLALHALNNLDLRQLAAFDGDPLEGWRRQDPEIIAQLAARQLRSSGVRPRVKAGRGGKGRVKGGTKGD
ncbi:hypothetical protein KCV87_28075 [Actinosynnema pretiosum subsp. pretiosum]|uniref:Uncharacterized protein n=1 Tax=Actinosynnema pretiosum subsp. pretiosum TaxID=103721 RepID=A0AA45R2X8_9PSEU|nr:putative CONSERVED TRANSMEMBRANE PROTEIN [Actinosynnema pretiosum subsp. pretiosum]QUF03242.1 hypothetical protein KCV87_28075 [Actinosynnema pretiosum subsp. pretiosum]